MSNVYTVKFNKDAVKDDEEEAYEVGKAAGVAVAATIGALIFAPFVVWIAWNLCMPALFGLPAIGYLQSLALYALFKILF